MDVESASINPIKAMLGWCSLETLVCLSDSDEIYDIDVRYSWGLEIFKQNLFDHGWNKNILLEKSKNKKRRFKLIIYLCEGLTDLDLEKRCKLVPERFLVGNHFQNIHHVYLPLPSSHPFVVPDYIRQKEQESYSTTYFLNKIYPSLTPQINSKNKKSTLFLPHNDQRLGEGGLRTKGLFKSSRPELPLISVITVVFNGEQYIEQTIQSIINQSYKNIEYIIIDGGSTDETVDVIRRYDDQINYWISEPDNGIYSAMNKALSITNGDWIFFLGSDDILFDADVIYRFFSSQKNFDVDVVFGDVIYSNNYYFKSQLNYKMLLRNTLHHQGCFYNKHLFYDYTYQDSYKICADYELNLKIYTQKCSYKYLNIPVSIFRIGGKSSINRNLSINEMNDIRGKHVNYVVNMLMILILKFRTVLRRLLGLG